MRHSLDTIGIAGFGHDFKTLDGHQSAVIEAFEAFGEARQGVTSLLFFFATTFVPLFGLIPNARMTLFKKLSKVTSEVAGKMLEDEQTGRKMHGAAASAKETSILGLLGRRLLAHCVTHNLPGYRPFSEGRVCD